MISSIRVHLWNLCAGFLSYIV